MLRRLAAFLICLVVFILFFTTDMNNFASEGVQAGTFITIPSITIPSLLLPANIPDPNLNAALHTACGKALSEPLYRSDLAALTGSLSVDSRNIANLEGIQYCTGITWLNASGNPLSALPNMSGMTGLTSLRLDDCDFATVPSIIRQIPNLLSLSMSANELTNIVEISGCLTLRYLTLRSNDLEALPGSLLLPNLESLELSDNKLDAIPPILLTLTSLKQLFINDNKIGEIPAAIADLPELFMLSLSGNEIRTLPAALGGSQLQSLYVKRNRITTLPSSVLDAPNLIILDIGVNRLTAVPAKLKDIAFDYLDVDFNYIDVSAGSSARTILDDVTAMTKHYEAQLTPIRNLQATATDTSISLSWDSCPDTDTGAYMTTVANYVVYLSQTEGLVQLAVLDKNTTMYTETGLASAAQRKYTVAVVYDILAPMLATSSRHYTSITTATLSPTPSPSPTPEPSPTLTPSPTPEPTTTGSSQATSQDPTTTAAIATTGGSTTTTTGSTDNPPDDAGKEAPLWLVIVLACVAGAGVAAAVILLVQKKKA